jgi:nicotinate-nucleotide adenylyltransferase
VRIAILGGTFDPIHNGHLAAAESVANLFQVDEFHFVTSFSPPHKPSYRRTSPFHRFAMVALATAPFARFRSSTIELDTLERQYTVETLTAMATVHPGAELLFVLGADMYEEIDSWKDYRRLFDLARLVVINRPGFTFRKDVAPSETLTESSATPALSAGRAVFYVPFVEQPISSTRIRDNWTYNDEVRGWLPPAVRGYIEKHKLYS